MPRSTSNYSLILIIQKHLSYRSTQNYKNFYAQVSLGEFRIATSRILTNIQCPEWCGVALGKMDNKECFLLILSGLLTSYLPISSDHTWLLSPEMPGPQISLSDYDDPTSYLIYKLKMTT